MSWRGEGSSLSRTKRMGVLARRLETVQLPPLSDVCARFTTDPSDAAEITRDFENRIFFSSFPEQDISLTLSTLSVSPANLDSLKRNGALGVVIEMIRRLPNCRLNQAQHRQHLSNLVECLHLMTDDAEVQRKLLANPFAVPALLSLVQTAYGEIQWRIIVIIERLTRLRDGVQDLVGHGIFSCLLSEELLFRQTTQTRVRHLAAQMLNRIAAAMPDRFLFDKFQMLCYHQDERRIDAFTEMQLLDASIYHLNFLYSSGRCLNGVCTIMEYLLNEIKNETYEDVSHLHQILRFAQLVSRDASQIGFMVHNGLALVLHYIVKTDFELWRKAPGSSAARHAGGEGNGPRNGASLVLNAIRNTASKKVKIEDVNYKSTKIAVQIYESVMEYDVGQVEEILTSGLISGLLFRVGKGSNVDPKFNRLVVKFVREILVLVSMAQNAESIALTEARTGGVHPSGPFGIGEVGAHSIAGSEADGDWDEASAHSGSIPKSTGLRSGSEKTLVASSPLVVEGHDPSSFGAGQKEENAVDLRSISAALHAQGVTTLFLRCVQDGDDIELLSHAIGGLGLMRFETIKGDICNESIVGKICFYAMNKHDCFYSGLSIVSEVIMYVTEICRGADEMAASENVPAADVAFLRSASLAQTRALLDACVVDFNVVSLFVKALQISTWIFKMKDIVFRALAKLAIHPEFYDRLRKSNGVSVLIFELKKLFARNAQERERKSVMQMKKSLGDKHGREHQDMEDEAVFIELSVQLRRDALIIKIQSCVRAFLARKRHIILSRRISSFMKYK